MTDCKEGCMICWRMWIPFFLTFSWPFSPLSFIHCLLSLIFSFIYNICLENSCLVRSLYLKGPPVLMSSSGVAAVQMLLLMEPKVCCEQRSHHQKTSFIDLLGEKRSICLKSIKITSSCFIWHWFLSCW